MLPMLVSFFSSNGWMLPASAWAPTQATDGVARSKPSPRDARSLLSSSSFEEKSVTLSLMPVSLVNFSTSGFGA